MAFALAFSSNGSFALVLMEVGCVCVGVGSVGTGWRNGGLRVLVLVLMEVGGVCVGTIEL